MNDLIAYVTTAGAGGVIVLFLRWLLDTFRTPADVRKLRAEADETAVETALGLVRELRVEVNRTKEQVTHLTVEVGRLQSLVAALESEIVTLGGDPTRVFRRFDPPEGIPV